MVTSNKERPKEQPNEQSNHDNTDKRQPSSRTLLPPPNHQFGGEWSEGGVPLRLEREQVPGCRNLLSKGVVYLRHPE